MIFCTSAASAIFFVSVTLPETFQTTPGGGLIGFPNQKQIKKPVLVSN